MLGLECTECGLIVFSIEAAHDHEEDTRTPEGEYEHGGWDTVRV